MSLVVWVKRPNEIPVVAASLQRAVGHARVEDLRLPICSVLNPGVLLVQYVPVQIVVAHRRAEDAVVLRNVTRRHEAANIVGRAPLHNQNPDTSGQSPQPIFQGVASFRIAYGRMIYADSTRAAIQPHSYEDSSSYQVSCREMVPLLGGAEY